MSKELEFIGFNGVEIDISDDKDIWLGKDLVIENCPNLIEINANNCGLRSLFIENCPQLQELNAFANELTELEIYELPNLVKLNVGFNKLTKLKITKSPKLEVIYCNQNNLSDLKIYHLSGLKELYCYKNKPLSKLDIDGLTKLEKLCSQECSLVDINPFDCFSLRELDLAENFLEDISLKDCQDLQILSLRDNHFKEFDDVFCWLNPKIKELYISNNFFEPVDLNYFFSFKSLEVLKLGLILPSDISNEEAEIRIKKYHKFNKFFGPLKKLKKDISIIFAGFINDFSKYKKVREQVEKERLIREEEKIKYRNSLPLSKYCIPAWKDNIFNLDLSWQRLGGKLVIEDWANLKKLNCGNNEIAELVIKNCPNLQWLNYAHNALIKQEIIEGCPLLTPENTFSESKGNYVLPDDFVPNTPIYEEKPQEQKIPEDKTNYDITAEYLESLTYEELLKLDIDTIPKDLKIATIKIITNKFKEKQEQAKQAKQEIRNKQIVNSLISKVQQALKENNSKELKAILKQLKSYAHSSAYKENKATISKLEQYLKQVKLQQAKNPEPINYSFYISICLLSVVFLTLSFKILQDKIKIFFKKIIKIN